MKMKVKVIKEENSYYLMVQEPEKFEEELKNLIGKETDCNIRLRHWLEPLDWQVLEEMKIVQKKLDRLLKNWSGTLD